MAFIVFEGLDGSGKSTLMRNLSEHLRSQQKNFIMTREPGGTPLAEDIRNLLLRRDGEAPVARTEVLLYQASRAQHVDTVIEPALKAGQWVLCDRFYASTVAFQCFARGLDRKQIDFLNMYATNNRKPDLTVLLDLPVKESLSRIEQRNLTLGSESDRMEAEKISFHQAVRDGYLAQADEDPESWLKLDAKKSPSDLFDLLRATLHHRRILEP